MGLFFCLILLLAPAFNVQAQELPEGGDVDINLEFKPNGHLHFDVTVQGETSVGPGGLGENSPVTSIGGSFQVSSPSSGQLELDAEGSITFSEGYLTPQMEMGFEVIDKESINNGIPGTSFEGLNSFEGKQLSTILSEQGYGVGSLGGELSGGISGGVIPSELTDLTIDELGCTSFSWNKPQISASFSAALSGTVFENEKVREWLPLDSDFSMEMSETSLDLTFGADTPKGELDLNLSSTVSDNNTQTIELVVEGYIELPHENGNVQWNPGSSGIQSALAQNYSQSLENQFEQSNVSVTLKVPSDAEVSGLPSGAQKEGDKYTWTGENVVSEFSSMLTGEAGTEVDYEYVPSGGGLPYIWIGVGITIVVILAAFVVAIRRR